MFLLWYWGPGKNWSLEMDKWFHPTHFNGCNYLSMLGLRLIHVSKRGPWGCVWFRTPNWDVTLQWRHKGRDNVSNYQPHNCFLKRLFRRRSKKTSKPRVTGHLCGDRWISCTSGQLRGKCFHLMTSSCTNPYFFSITISNHTGRQSN